MALLQTLLPNDDLPEQESQADLEALTKLSKNSALSGKLEVSSRGDDGFANVVSLAWGVMLLNHGPPNFRRKASSLSDLLAACVRHKKMTPFISDF